MNRPIVLLLVALLFQGVTQQSPLFADHHERILQSLRSGDAKERATVIDKLANDPQAAAFALDALKKALKDDEAWVRWRAARTLGEWGSTATAARGALVAALADADVVVQAQAAAALGNLGDKSDSTVVALIAATGDVDPRLRRAAVQSLLMLEVSPQKLVEAFVAALHSGDQTIAIHAVESMVDRGQASVPFLMEALNHPEAAYWACVAIEQLGEDAADAVEPIIALLDRDDEANIHAQALLALAAIGPSARAGGAVAAPMTSMPYASKQASKQASALSS